jgi:chemotaxis signal transduction protein
MESLRAMQTYLGAIQAEETEAEMLAAGLNLTEILESRQIIGLMKLQGVPRGQLLVKGVLENHGGAIPLVDLRMRLEAAHRGKTDDASVLIVFANGVEIGLIVDGGCEA